ncbi:MAG: multidrug effflux MFS transporter [Legionella sp.]|nr:multidrug effflux MFS transporter [Legionella sp.]
MSKYTQPTSMKPLILINIFLLICIAQMCAEQYLPSLPYIAEYYSQPGSSIALTLTLYFLGTAISHLLYGPLSDKIGRKPPLILGIGINVLGSLICMLAPTIYLLILGRFLQGFGIGCCMSVGRSVIRDSYQYEILAKATSYAGICNIVVTIAAPIIGGFIQVYFGWRANFIFLFFLGLTVWLFVVCYLPETNTSLNNQAMKLKVMGANYKTLVVSPVFLGNTLCCSFAWMGLVAYFTIAPFFFQNILGLNPVQYGQLSIFIASAICLSSLLSGWLVMIVSVERMISLGVVLMTVGSLLLYIIHSFSGLTVLIVMTPICIFSVGAGFAFINTFAAAFQPFPHIAGTASALYASILDFSGAFMSGAIALSDSRNIRTLAIMIIVSSGGALTSWLYTLRHHETSLSSKE